MTSHSSDASTVEQGPVAQRILQAISASVPLSPTPWDELARSLDIAPQACLTELHRLKEQRLLRQISAIFDTQALGYRSSLVAAKYPDNRLDAAAAIVNEHPGVSHNYQREGPFNLWYTLTLPPESRLDLQGTADKLHDLTQAESTRLLPTLRLFKIDTGNLLAQASSNIPRASSYTQADRQTACEYPITPIDRQRILALQTPLELIPRPFDTLARQVGEPVETLLAAAKLMIERRQMRRYAAVLHHRQAGLTANVLVVWRWADENQAVQRAGELMAQSPAISHCYQRPTYPDWPYSLYTMIHGQTREQCLATIEPLRSRSGALDHRLLWSVREYKKVRVRYFTDDVAHWEQRHA